uniref:Uncharacterized protein n=1 Tax=Rhizophora mucronata TaxID=61149 RepID=A0A2P2IQ97_RHIMU
MDFQTKTHPHHSEEHCNPASRSSEPFWISSLSLSGSILFQNGNH